MKTLLFNDFAFVFPLLFLITVSVFIYYPNALVIVICFILLLWFISVFRIEERITKNTVDQSIVSPVDGTLLEIREHDDSFTFVFFNSIFDSQAQWAPYAGKVIAIDTLEGDRNIAWSLEYHDDNAQDVITIETDIGNIVINKISSWMTLKERNFVNVDDKIAQGQALGYIIFPARIDVTVPKLNTSPVLHQNQKVIGGKTIIAKLK